MMMTSSELKTLKPHPIQIKLESYRGRHPRIRPILNRKELDKALIWFVCYDLNGKPIGQKTQFDAALEFVESHNQEKVL